MYYIVLYCIILYCIILYYIIYIILYYIIFYITHKNILVILLVNTTSHDIKYFAYIPDTERGNKVTIKKAVMVVLRSPIHAN